MLGILSRLAPVKVLTVDVTAWHARVPECRFEIAHHAGSGRVGRPTARLILAGAGQDLLGGEAPVAAVDEVDMYRSESAASVFISSAYGMSGPEEV